MSRRTKLAFAGLITLIFVLYLNFSSSNQIPPISFCPISTSINHVPTLILQPSLSLKPDQERTHWAGGEDSSTVLLPLQSPSKLLRFTQLNGDSRRNTGRGRLGSPLTNDSEEGQRLCPVFSVPSSPLTAIPKRWRSNKIMFGMSTIPDRVLASLDVWSHWLPSSLQPLDPNSSLIKELPLALILTPPPNPTEAARMREAVDEAQSLGMKVQMKAAEATRFETRYFALVQEMWNEATRIQAEEGVVTEWFVLADDDTFWPDFNSLIRLLSKYDSSKPHIIGALSESTRQVAEWGHIAYGGAGIYVSRALMAKMNAPGAWLDCLDKFGSSFGGDAMVSHCAARVSGVSVQEILTVEDTLHQLDIRGDSTGWFQSGFLITSLHHWGSWFTLFPPWMESGIGDQTFGIRLVGKASEAVGGDNFGRRYIFDEGRVVVVVGYSVTIYAVPLTVDDLSKSEHTWFEFETFHPMRPALEEGLEKRTYYLTGLRGIGKGVTRLEHKNREGEKVDLIWDGRM